MSGPAGLPEAIAYLQQSSENGRSLYDHLSSVLLKLLEQRPARAYDSFEALSFELKQSTATRQLPRRDEAAADTTGPAGVPDLLRPKDDEEGGLVTASNEGDMADVQEQLDMFEWAGVAVASREEAYCLVLSLRKLIEREPLQSVRLWGKILGREADYYVAESLYKEGAEETAAPSTAGAALAEGGRAGSAHDSDLSDSEAEARAKKAQEEAAKLASETPSERGAGTNKYVYWVCHHPGEAWVKLPHVTPAQIKAARGARKLLTGRLDAAVRMWPVFPGNEANLLRAQISRISAACIVSPRGYYAPEETEDEEEEQEPTAVLENEEYTGMSAESLLDPRNWVHHQPAIRMQGTVWVAPRQGRAGSGDEDEDAENEDDEEHEQEATQNPEELEQTPKLLTAVSEDEQISSKAAWNTKLGSRISKNPPVFAYSNRWPGAFACAYASGSKFANLYVGYGMKYADKPFIPEMPKAPEADDGIATQFIEQADPTVAEEQEVERKKAEEEEAKRREAEEAAKAEAENSAAGGGDTSAEDEQAGVTDSDALQTGTEEEEEEEEEEDQ
eukprot:m51a1_g3517 putative radial spoke head protein 4 homolog a (560) ;mRNA; r:908146-910192